MNDSRMNPRIIAIVLIVISVALNVYGWMTLPDTINVGGIFSKTGEPIEVPTLLVLVLLVFFTGYMCVKMAINKREDATVTWIIVNCAIVVFNAVVIFFLV